MQPEGLPEGRTYAWVIDGVVYSGSLQQYADHRRLAQYAGLDVGIELWDGIRMRPVMTRELRPSHNKQGYIDTLHYYVYVTDAQTDKVTDWATMNIAAQG